MNSNSQHYPEAKALFKETRLKAYAVGSWTVKFFSYPWKWKMNKQELKLFKESKANTKQKHTRLGGWGVYWPALDIRMREPEAHFRLKQTNKENNKCIKLTKCTDFSLKRKETTQVLEEEKKEMKKVAVYKLENTGGFTVFLLRFWVMQFYVLRLFWFRSFSADWREEEEITDTNSRRHTWSGCVYACVHKRCLCTYTARMRVYVG